MAAQLAAEWLLWLQAAVRPGHNRQGLQLVFCLCWGAFGGMLKQALGVVRV